MSYYLREALPPYCPTGSAYAGYDNGRLCKKEGKDEKAMKLVDGKLAEYAAPAPVAAPAATQGRKMRRSSCKKRNMVWIAKNHHSKGYCRKNNSKSKSKKARRSRKSKSGKRM
jgi:hypothetical protein